MNTSLFKCRAALWVGCLSLIAAGCGEGTLEITEPAYVDHDPVELTAGLTLGDTGGCDTGVVSALTKQLVAELNCIAPNSMVDVSGPDVRLGAAGIPFLNPMAAAALERATTAANDFITLNDAYRSVAQQYLLYKWWQQGRCRIQIAAPPGDSNHQSGRAIDVEYYSYWRPYLTGQGWVWYGTDDLVHYDFPGSANLARSSVLAFQRLWNKNHSTGKLVEDGIWGPASNGAMAASPAEGFPVSGCNNGGTDQMAPGVNITFPMDGTSVDTTVMTMTGVATDNAGPLTKVSFRLNGGTAIELAVQSGKFARDIQLRPGANTLEVSATDAAGNTAKSTSTVRFNAGINGQVITAVDPMVAVTDAQVDLRIPATGELLATTKTDGEGKFRIDLLKVPADLLLSISAGGFITSHQQISVGADARLAITVQLVPDGVTLPKPELNPKPGELPNTPGSTNEQQQAGGCSTSVGLLPGLCFLAILAFRRRRPRSPRA